MRGPAAPLRYVRMAAAAASAAMEHLTPAARRCLQGAQAQSRRLDDNHVGTEHIVLGVLTTDSEIADTLAETGVTEDVFRAQLYGEPGPSPAGTIPLTPRAQMILGFARSAGADGEHMITPRHLMLGVIAESRDWHERGFTGPYHLEKAATAARTSLAEIESVLLHQ